MFFSLGLAPSSFIFTVQSIFLAVTPETEFLDEIQAKVLRVFLYDIHSHLYTSGFTPSPLPPHPEQYYAQKPQRKCTFMNLASAKQDWKARVN
jgi:hypothetical protein